MYVCVWGFFFFMIEVVGFVAVLAEFLPLRWHASPTGGVPSGLSRNSGGNLFMWQNVVKTSLKKKKKNLRPIFKPLVVTQHSSTAAFTVSDVQQPLYILQIVYLVSWKKNPRNSPLNYSSSGVRWGQLCTINYKKQNPKKTLSPEEHISNVSTSSLLNDGICLLCLFSWAHH